MQTTSRSVHTGTFPALVCFITAATVILANPSAAANGAADGLKLSASVIIPALFPFTVVALFFAKSGALSRVGEKLHRVFDFLFGISGTGGTILLLSLLGGYPVGAKLISSVTESGCISQREAQLLLRFCANPSPAFFLAYIGESLFHSRTVGIILLLANTAACLLLTALFGKRQAKKETPKFHALPNKNHPVYLTDAFVESVAEAANIILSITAWVTLFSCICGLLAPLLPQAVHAILCPLLEITSGAVSIYELGIPPYLCSLLLAFGGCATLCQVRQAAGSLRPTFFFLLTNRLLHGVIATLCSALLFFLFPVAQPVWNNGASPQFAVPELLPASVALLLMAIVFLCTLNPAKQKSGVL